MNRNKIILITIAMLIISTVVYRVSQTDETPLDHTIPIYDIKVNERKLSNALTLSMNKEGIEAVLIANKISYPIRVQFFKTKGEIKVIGKKLIEKNKVLRFIKPKKKRFFYEFMSNYINQKLGLLTPESRFALLKINSELVGVFYLKDEYDQLFGQNIRLTKDADFRPGIKEESQKNYDRLLALIQNPKSKYEDFQKLIDTNSLSAHMAKRIYQSFWQEMIKEYLLYNPLTGRFHYYEDKPDGEGFKELQKLHKRLLAFPQYLYSKQIFINKLFREVGKIKVVEKLLLHELSEKQYFLKNEEMILFPESDTDPEDVKVELNGFLKSIKLRKRDYERTINKISLKQLDANSIVFHSIVPLRIDTLGGKEFFAYPRHDVEKEIKIQITKVDTPERITKISNAITGKELIPTNTHFPIPKIKNGNLEPIINQIEKIIWKGRVEVEGVKIINKDQLLIIEPGTKIIMKENSSLVVYGGIEAKGEEEEKIEFTTTTEKPFDLIAINHSSHKENVLSHVNISNGDAGISDNVNYVGMLNILNSRVTLKNNYIFNSRGRYAVNIIGGNVLIENNIFMNSKNSSLGIRLAEGRIVGNLILNSGINGLEVSRGNNQITSNMIINSSEKGLMLESFYEGNVVGNIIADSHFGIVAASSTKAVLEKNALLNNKIGMASYRGDKLHEGASITESKNCLIHNDENYLKDEFSVIFKNSKCDKAGESFKNYFNQRIEMYGSQHSTLRSELKKFKQD